MALFILFVDWRIQRAVDFRWALKFPICQRAGDLLQGNSFPFPGHKLTRNWLLYWFFIRLFQYSWIYMMKSCYPSTFTTHAIHFLLPSKWSWYIRSYIREAYVRVLYMQDHFVHKKPSECAAGKKKNMPGKFMTLEIEFWLRFPSHCYPYLARPASKLFHSDRIHLTWFHIKIPR